MTDYLFLAQNNEISFVEAYVKTQNAILTLVAKQTPTSQDYAKSEYLQKQLKLIAWAITEEAIRGHGYEQNPKTFLWEITSLNNQTFMEPKPNK